MIYLNVEGYNRTYTETESTEPSSPDEVVRNSQLAAFEKHTDVASQGSDR